MAYVNQISSQNHFIQQNIQTSTFILRTYLKSDNDEQPLRIYIEGDGFAWVNRNTLSNDPTPVKPIAFELASIDGHKNIAYIARPCQYTINIDTQCNNQYWSKKRFSKEVVDSVNEAIDILKSKQKNKNIELVGFSGGAAIATLVAANRDDVTKIITVAGNLNHKLLNEYHHVSQMNDSLNPVDIANKISHIQQLHFVGADDKIVPVLIADSFKKSSPTQNIQVQIVPNTTHTKGWSKVWKDLLKP